MRENNAKIESLEKYLNAKLAELRTMKDDNEQLNAERLHYLRTWYNNQRDKNKDIKFYMDCVSTSYLPTYDYMIEQVKILLHKQTQNNTRYRGERHLINGIMNYINENTSYWVYRDDVKRLIDKYNSKNAKYLGHKLRLEQLLRARKERSTQLLVNNRGYRQYERKNLTHADRAVMWYNDRVKQFSIKVSNHFISELEKLGINDSYLSFNTNVRDIVKWYEDITKNHTMTLGQLKGHIYKTLREKYNNSIKGYNNCIEKDMKEKALQKHELATMTAKQRKQVQFEKWSKVKNVLTMFSGAIEIDKKIDFDNYVPVTPTPTVTTVKQVINECGVVENHETLSDGTTRIALYV